MTYQINWTVGGAVKMQVGSIMKISDIQPILDKISKDNPAAQDLNFTVTNGGAK